ncbi:hypothetical protein [Fibrobacter sp.]|uniref:hypothetical protein n=1 Tax=Fibrobacter sp. TaxID=35828 RepID=UPI0038672827
MKEFFKLLAPYATTIASAIALYASFQTRLGVLEYRTDAIEERSTNLQNDIGSIKDLLYSIDTKIGVYAAILDERTSKNMRRK